MVGRKCYDHQLLPRVSSLLENAEQGLAEVQALDRITSIPALEAYRLARLTFFTDYVYVLNLTGPVNHLPRDQIPLPDGFQTRPLAVKLLEIGARWQYLHG